MNLKRNKKIPIACIEKGLTQRELAKMAGIHESVLSNAIAGRWILSEAQQRKIALILGQEVGELFPND